MRRFFVSTFLSLIFYTSFFYNSTLAKAEVNNNFINTMATVHITGAVNKPGIYKVPTGMRLVDVLSKAGGLKKEAYVSDLNLTQAISDGTTIHIANKQEVQKTVLKTNMQISSNNTKNHVKKPINYKNAKVEKKHKNQSKNNNKNINSNVLININKASEEELSSLPGVGEKLAKNIIIYRAKHGGFKSIDELKNIERVGDKKFNKLKNRVKI